MRAKTTCAGLVLLVAWALPACSGDPAPITSVPFHAPKGSREMPTTSAPIYLGNLDGQIEELTRLASLGTNHEQSLQQLSGAHYIRGRYRGDLGEIQEAIDGVDECVRIQPANVGCVLMRAEEEQSLHRFEAANGDAERARALGADPGRLADLEADLDWNGGRYEKATLAIRRARRERPSTATWKREAELEDDLGHEALAESAFLRAEALIVDTTPLPVAHLDVARGMERARHGHLEEACVLFREAVRRMPTYVAANEHLAETLAALGKDDEATSIYESVVRESDDPEFAYALSRLYAAHGRRDEAKALVATASSRYEELLSRFPEAMYGHASEFFFDTGDLSKAADLLEKNLTLRPGVPSYVALARVRLALGDAVAAKTAIDAALAMPLRSSLLFSTAADVYERLGDSARVTELRARARLLNPRDDGRSVGLH